MLMNYNLSEKSKDTISNQKLLEQGTLLKEVYQIENILGKGGFGITYKATDLQAKKTVAIKALYENNRREAEILASFRQKSGIVQIENCFEEEGTIYLVMDYIEGITLKKFLEKKGPILWSDAIQMLIPLMESLKKIHATSLVHRDISASNIMVLPDETLALLDFGAAIYMNQEEHIPKIAKKGYAPIEQYSEEGMVGTWTDVYAVTAVLYECITGKLPPSALQRVIYDEYKKISDFGIEVPNRFEEVCEKGLAIRVQDRYQTIEELQEAILYLQEEIARNIVLPYEEMLEELFYEDAGKTVLARIVEPKNWKKTDSMPLRYRLIGQGFTHQLGVEQVNEKLIEHGCRPLYSRNGFECTLIYAFSKKLKYAEWCKLYLACEKVREQWLNQQQNREGFLTGRNITFGDLEKYVLYYSDVIQGELITKHVTQNLSGQVRQIDSDYKEFFQFYASVMDDFTDVHEKARYYFCKYLYYHLCKKIDKYKLNIQNRVPKQEELLELLPLKAESILRRRVTPEQELMEVFRDCSVSPGAIFEEFNYHFFEYVSMNWVELLLENIRTITELSDEQIKTLASYLRDNISSKYRKEVQNMTDLEVVDWKLKQIQEASNAKNNRKGETAMRKYLRGELDLDRTTLICFLLYFNSSLSSRKKIKITRKRLNVILRECGFSMLHKKNAFDQFVIKYMESPDPVSVLMLEMDKYIESGKNFFMYEMYANSSSYAKEIRKFVSKFT